MKINEVAKLTGKELFESLDRDNDTGFKTEDLMKIVEQHRSNKWEDVDADDFLAELDADIAATEAKGL